MGYFYFFFSSEAGTNPLYLFHSNYKNFNQLYSESLRVPIITTYSQDDNRDGKLDRLEFGLEMPLTADESIHRVSAILYFDVTISKKAKYNFDAVAYFNYDSGAAVATIYADGDLVFRQTQPLSSKGGCVYIAIIILLLLK